MQLYPDGKTAGSIIAADQLDQLAFAFCAGDIIVNGLDLGQFDVSAKCNNGNDSRLILYGLNLKPEAPMR